MLEATQLIGFGCGSAVDDAALCWRILMVEAQDDGYAYYGAAQIEFRVARHFVNEFPVDASKQSATGGTAIASSERLSKPKTAAFDADYSNGGWNSNVKLPGEWIGYQFPAPVKIVEFFYAADTGLGLGGFKVAQLQKANTASGPWLTVQEFSVFKAYFTAFGYGVFTVP